MAASARHSCLAVRSVFQMFHRCVLVPVQTPSARAGATIATIRIPAMAPPVVERICPVTVPLS